MKRSYKKDEDEINYDSDKSDVSVEIGNDIPLVPKIKKDLTEINPWRLINISRDTSSGASNDDGDISDSSIEIDNNIHPSLETTKNSDNTNDNDDTKDSSRKTVELMQDYYYDDDSLYNSMFPLAGDDKIDEMCGWIED